MSKHTIRFLNYSNLAPSSKIIYERTINQLIDFTSMDPLIITSDNIAAFKEYRLTKANRVTVNKDLHRLSSFYEFLVSDNLIKENPVKRIKKYKLKKSEQIKIRYIKHEDALKLIKQPILPLIEPTFKRQRDQVILAILYYCGLRTSEVVKLRWKDINFDERSLHIFESKGNLSRYVSMPVTLVNILKGYLSYFKGEGKLFEISDDMIRIIVSKYAKEAGTQVIGDKMKVTPVILRHSYATFLTEKGVSPITLGDLMGNPTAVKHYSHITKAGKDKAADFFD